MNSKNLAVKRNLIAVIMIAVICCSLMLLFGCGTNGSNENSVIDGTNGESVENIMSPPDTTPPIQTEPATQETTQGDEEQPPDSPAIDDTEPAESMHTATVDANFDDGAEARLIVSGRELVQHWAVLMGSEALVPDFTYIFGNLNCADGQNAGFFSIGVSDTNTNLKTAVIMNSAHNITIVEGEYSFTHNDVIMPLTVPAQMIRGTFHVPLMAIANAIGAAVEWDEAAQAILFFFER